MSRLLVDAMAWNYVAKAGVLPRFLKSLKADSPVILPPIAGQLQRALTAWPELGAVLYAVSAKQLDNVDLTDTEEATLAALLDSRPALGSQDCALLAVALMRDWPLLTCDKQLRKAAQRVGIELIELVDVLDAAVSRGHLSSEDKEWVVYYSRGGTRRRADSTWPYSFPLTLNSVQFPLKNPVALRQPTTVPNGHSSFGSTRTLITEERFRVSGTVLAPAT